VRDNGDPLENILKKAYKGYCIYFINRDLLTYENFKLFLDIHSPRSDESMLEMVIKMNKKMKE